MTTELHIMDSDTSGNVAHIRQFDNDSTWTVEIVGNPKVAKKFAASGATVQRSDSDSALFNADTEKVIELLAELGGYNCKLSKKVKRQFSPETLAAKRERAATLRKK